MIRKQTPGFTLIELLVVIAIIGLLSSMVMLALNGARQKSRDATRLADVRQIGSALELFFSVAGGYPTGTNYKNASTTMGSTQLLFVGSSGTYYFTPTYMAAVPTAPTPVDNSSGTACNSSNNNFFYLTNDRGSAYTLSFCLGAATGGYGAGYRILTPLGIQ